MTECLLGDFLNRRYVVMHKRNTILTSLLLILTGVIVQVILKKSGYRMDEELMGFLSGFFIGGGVILLVQFLVIKKIL
jgi:heme/copper-type cytochrome/quinol oxidase subunit 1